MQQHQFMNEYPASFERPSSSLAKVMILQNSSAFLHICSSFSVMNRESTNTDQGYSKKDSDRRKRKPCSRHQGLFYGEPHNTGDVLPQNSFLWGLWIQLRFWHNIICIIYKHYFSCSVSLANVECVNLSGFLFLLSDVCLSWILRLKYREMLLIQSSDQPPGQWSLSFLPAMSPVQSFVENTHFCKDPADSESNRINHWMWLLLSLGTELAILHQKFVTVFTRGVELCR